MMVHPSSLLMAPESRKWSKYLDPSQPHETRKKLKAPSSWLWLGQIPAAMIDQGKSAKARSVCVTLVQINNNLV